MRYQKKDDSFDLAIEKWNRIRQFVENASTLSVRPAVVKCEGMSFISTSLAQDFSLENDADNVMVEKIIKEKLGETTNN